MDALAEVDTTGQDTIKVSYADKWAQSRNLENNAASIAGVAGNGSGSNGSSSLEDTGNTTVIETVKDYDWTYTTVYAGTCSGHLVSLPKCHVSCKLRNIRQNV